MTRKSFYTCVTAVVAVLMMTSLHGFADPVRNYPAGADPDIMFSSGTNPAGLGFSQGLGIGFGAEIPADQDTVYNPLLVEQDTYVGFSAGSLGIAYESDGENSMFSVGQGFELLPGFSLGFATHTPSWAWSKSEFQAGTLWRPHAALSIGGIYRADIGNAWSVHPGIGLRPLALIPGLQDFGHRVTFTADAAYSEEGPSGEAYGLQRIGTQIEPLQGLRLYGGYQLSGDWNVGIEAAFGYSRNGISFALDDSVQLRSARVYSNVEVPGYPGPPATPKSRIIEFSGLQVVAEVEGLQSFGEFTFGDGSRPFTAVVEEIEELAADPSVAGILFTNPVFNGDMSHAIEIAAALQRFRQTGKTVVFSIEQADSLTYLVAALGADEIYLRPAGMLAVYGFSSSSLYFADFFDRFGINAVGFESHPSKSANHAFTESGMTEEARENTEAYLGSLFSSYLDLVAQGRGDRLAGEPAELWDDAPYLVAAQAEDAGLVDGLMYHDQVLELLEERLPEAEVMQMQTMELRNPAWHTPRRSRIAVIYAVGPIMTGEGLQGTSIGSDTLARQIREAREDDSIDA
ncbi:MAG: S49 family peptidase, partial [Spirochaeta sp.]